MCSALQFWKPNYIVISYRGRHPTKWPVIEARRDMTTTMYCIWGMNFIADTTENFSHAPHFNKRGDVDALQATYLTDMMNLGCAEDEERAPPQFLFTLRLLYTAWCADETPDGDHKRQAAKAAYEKLRQDKRALWNEHDPSVDEFGAGLEKAVLG